MSKVLFVNWHKRAGHKPNSVFMQLGVPLFTAEEKQKLTFKEKMASFFIKHGSYKITPKAESLPEIQEILKKRGITIGTEQKDSVSTRDKDELYIEGLAYLTRNEKRRVIRESVSDLIDQGQWKHLYAQNAIKFRAPNKYWNDPVNRKFWLKEMIAFLGKEPQKILKRDFEENGLVGFLHHYKNSLYKPISELYPQLKEWEMYKTPRNFFDKKKNRVAAVKWLCEKLGKDPRNLASDDFQSNGLWGLAFHNYSNSPFKAVSEAYSELGIKAWEMWQTPNRFFDKKKNRVEAMTWLVEKLGKDPQELSKDDFLQNGLASLLHSHNSIYQAVAEAFPERGINPWEMSVTPMNFFDVKKNRIKALKWLIAKLGKDACDLQTEDFHKGLESLLFAYGGSPFKAVSESYPKLNIKPWEMSKTPSNFFDSPENRVKAVKWLVKKIGKDPIDLGISDFVENRLVGLIDFYGRSTFQAVSETFPKRKINAWEMKATPRGFYNEKQNRIVATKWLVRKLKRQKLIQSPKDLTKEDFSKNRLYGILEHRTHFQAITEAYPNLGINEWEMASTPSGFYLNKENRIKAINWLLETTKKDAKHLTAKDFSSNRLAGLLNGHYQGSPYLAVLDVFPNLKPEDMKNKHHMAK